MPEMTTSQEAFGPLFFDQTRIYAGQWPRERVMRLRRPAGADFCGIFGKAGRFGSLSLVPSGNSIKRLKVPPARPSITNLVPTGNFSGRRSTRYAITPSNREVRNSPGSIAFDLATLWDQCVAPLTGFRRGAVIPVIPRYPSSYPDMAEQLGENPVPGPPRRAGRAVVGKPALSGISRVLCDRIFATMTAPLT